MADFTRRHALRQPLRLVHSTKTVNVVAHKRRRPLRYPSPWWVIQPQCRQVTLTLTPREIRLLQKVRAQRRRQRRTDALVRLYKLGELLDP